MRDSLAPRERIVVKAPRLKDITVQAENCYDPAEYILVHERFFHGMREAIRRAHGDQCICGYCDRPVSPQSEKP